jgi:3-isopropylmalate dehydratase small subunit
VRVDFEPQFRRPPGTRRANPSSVAGNGGGGRGYRSAYGRSGVDPIETVSIIEGTAYPLGLDDIDTDVIIAAEWLKTIGRTGLGAGAFESFRKNGDTVFDDPHFQGSPILIAGRNFGCGSSREHAVWALLDIGVKAVIARSFSDIFESNAFKNGMVAISLGEQAVDRLLEVARDSTIRIDLPGQVVTAPGGECFAFDFDPFRKHCLIQGIDEIGFTEQKASEIERFERRSKAERPFFQSA